MPDPRLRFDPGYIAETSGIIKVGCLILAIASIITNNVGPVTGGTIFYNVVVIMGFWYTLILLLLFIFHVIEALDSVPWIFVEMVCTAIISLLYLISSIIVVISVHAAHIVAGIFGFCTLVLYLFDLAWKYRLYSSGAVAQGSVSQSPPPAAGAPSTVYPG